MPTDVFDLYGRVRLDTSEYEKSLDNAGGKFDGLGDKIKNGLGAITAATGAAVAAGAAAVGKVVSDAVGAYGEYEQLVGGVETLFGDSAAEVLANSEKAFQTAGMSVNEYMETSIQSAAALINSLGGDTSQAAELMDMSIRDMSDNVNKMGTSMESIQNAYRGFSRQNFTMLDNLSLGFAGTKEGMEELLKKAEQISGIKYDISSYSDIVQAIHVVQQEMGITGTTAAEAADTIQGSTGSMKAAWENLKVELVKEDGDISQSLDILVDSALTVFDNLEPKIERALGGVSQFVTKAAPILIEKLPPMIESILPPLLSASGSLVFSIGKGVASALPVMFDMLKSGISNLGGLVSSLDWKEISYTVGDFILNLDWEGILRNVAGTLANIIVTIPNIASGLFEAVSTHFLDFMNGKSQLVATEITGVFSEAAATISGMDDTLKEARDNMKKLTEAAGDEVEAEYTQINRTQDLWNELQKLVDQQGNVKRGYEDRVNYITHELEQATGQEIKIIDGQIQKYGELKEKIQETINLQRAQAMSNAYQDVYQEALTSRAKYGDNYRTLNNQFNDIDTELRSAYAEFTDTIRHRGIGATADTTEYELLTKLSGFDYDTFRESLGTGNYWDSAIQQYLGDDRATNLRTGREERDTILGQITDLNAQQDAYNDVIANYEQGYERLLAGNYTLAERSFAKLGENGTDTLRGLAADSSEALQNISDDLDKNISAWGGMVDTDSSYVRDEVKGKVNDVVDYAKENSISGAELMKEGIISKLSEIDGFDATDLQIFMTELGITFGDILAQAATGQISRSLVTQLQYLRNDLIQDVVQEDGSIRFGGINSPGDVDYYLPHARGGIFRRTTHIFGEDGDEAVIPLEHDERGIRQIADALSRNMGGAGNTININVTAGEGTDAKSLAQRIAEEVDKVLNDRRVAATRAVGGVAW